MILRQKKLAIAATAAAAAAYLFPRSFLVRTMSTIMPASTHPDNDVVVVYVTTPSVEVAESVAKKLLERRQIACANIIPKVTSMYWWDGKINKDDEQLMVRRKFCCVKLFWIADFFFRSLR
jgi:periplasmic divalent cation tolerance protein